MCLPLTQAKSNMAKVMKMLSTVTRTIRRTLNVDFIMFEDVFRTNRHIEFPTIPNIPIIILTSVINGYAAMQSTLILKYIEKKMLKYNSNLGSGNLPRSFSSNKWNRGFCSCLEFCVQS